MQFRMDAVMIVTFDLFPIKNDRVVNGIRALNAISSTNHHQTFMCAETAEGSHHTPIGNAIAYVNTEMWIVKRGGSLHQTRITHVDFEIAFVERLQ